MASHNIYSIVYVLLFSHIDCVRSVLATRALGGKSAKSSKEAKAGSSKTSKSAKKLLLSSKNIGGLLQDPALTTLPPPTSEADITSTESTSSTSNTSTSTSNTSTSSTETTHPATTTSSISDGVTSSCSTAQALTVPTILSDQTLTNVTPESLNPTFAGCSYGDMYPSRFDFPNPKIAWYETTTEENTCFCAELRSLDNAFIIAVLQDDDDDDECKDMTCINESDFTSESIAWRTSPFATYKLAVSALPDGPDIGSYQLNLARLGPDACPEESGSSVLIPGGCPGTQCDEATSESNCNLLDDCFWCQAPSSIGCVSKNGVPCELTSCSEQYCSSLS